MKIVEIFSSIQGEGNYIGVACTFVRFFGCNLSCSFCDTPESWKNDKAKWYDYEIKEIVTKCIDFKQKFVILTGGEPCIQQHLGDLVDQLMVHGMIVAIETNGTQATPQGVHWVTCSPKADADYKISPFCKANELKYVVTPDFDPSVITEELRNMYAGKIWLQPEGGDMQAMWQRCYELAMQDFRLRVGVQLHKLMEVQ